MNPCTREDAKKKMQFFYDKIHPYCNFNELEKEFNDIQNKEVRYSKVNISPGPNCLSYYICDLKPSKLFRQYKEGYSTVWIGESGKYLKSQYRNNLLQPMTTYYKYFETMQVKIQFERIKDTQITNLRYVQICEYNAETMMIDTVTNFYILGDFDCAKDVIHHCSGVAFSYENNLLSESSEYDLRIIYNGKSQISISKIYFFIKSYRHEHINGGVVSYWHSKTTDYYHRIDKDYSKYHYYNNYFMGMV